MLRAVLDIRSWSSTSTRSLTRSVEVDGDARRRPTVGCSVPVLDIRSWSSTSTRSLTRSV